MTGKNFQPRNSAFHNCLKKSQYFQIILNKQVNDIHTYICVYISNKKNFMILKKFEGVIRIWKDTHAQGSVGLILWKREKGYPSKNKYRFNAVSTEMLTKFFSEIERVI